MRKERRQDTLSSSLRIVMSKQRKTRGTSERRRIMKHSPPAPSKYNITTSCGSWWRCWWCWNWWWCMQTSICKASGGSTLNLVLFCIEKEGIHAHLSSHLSSREREKKGPFYVFSIFFSLFPPSHPSLSSWSTPSWSIHLIWWGNFTPFSMILEVSLHPPLHYPPTDAMFC